MEKRVHLKYLIANEQDLLWGLTINTVGGQSINKGAPYPPQNHPTRYLFSTERGRVLDEYQLIYITQGAGTFTSSNFKKNELKEGQMFLLFPGEWHSYRPDPLIGWNEYWIGFTGLAIDERVKNNFFSPQRPIYNVGLQNQIVQLYSEAIDVAAKQESGFQQLLAGIVNHLLGIAYSQNKHSSFEELKVANQINKAKIIMAENYNTEISAEEIAQQVNMSYSWFRKLFKDYTGFAPAQYMQELRIHKCKELLTNTVLSSQEISYSVGFDNPDYFYTVFKRKTGMTPSKYRDKTQGKGY